MAVRSPRAPRQRQGSAASHVATGLNGTRASTARRRVVRRLTLLYGAALVLIALIVVAYASVRARTFQPRLATDLTAVGLVTQEETSSERLARDALGSLSEVSSFDVAERAAFADDMHSTLSLLQIYQAILHGTNGQPGLRGLDTPDLDLRYGVVEPHYQALVSATQDFLAEFTTSETASTTPNVARVSLLVHTVVTEGQTYEAGMQGIGDRYKEDADNIQQQETVLDRVLVGLTIVALLLVGLVVFLPATWRVGRSIDELARAEEQQRELAVLKDQFIIYANHELRTPVMALYNSLELLDAVSKRGDDPERRARLLKRALASGDAVIRLLQSVLDTGVMEAQAPRVELAPMALAPVVRAVLETFDPREIGEPDMESGIYRSREVSLDVPADLTVLANEGRLRQVLINLIGNALKYSPAGTPIAITAVAVADQRRPRLMRAPWRLLRGRGDEGSAGAPVTLARVSVRDHGLGVPPRDVGKLFNRFVRLERDIAGSVRGTGVGLYLCRMLVEAMGGRIWVESRGVAGEGSTFSFTLPLALPIEDGVPGANVPALAGISGAPQASRT